MDLLSLILAAAIAVSSSGGNSLAEPPNNLDIRSTIIDTGVESTTQTLPPTTLDIRSTIIDTGRN